MGFNYIRNPLTLEHSVCVCVCACVRACVCVRVCVCVCVQGFMLLFLAKYPGNPSQKLAMSVRRRIKVLAVGEGKLG